MRAHGDLLYVPSTDNNLYALDRETREVVWSYERDRPLLHPTPVVENGYVYCTSRDHSVYALDPDTGEEEWRYFADGPVGGGVNVVDGRVHFGSYGEINIHALDADTGQHLWDKEVNSSLCTVPAVYDGTVYTSYVDRPFYAYDAATGEERWRFEPDDDWVRFGDTEAPVVWNDLVLAASDTYLYALDVDDGSVEWKTETGWINKCGATVADGVAFVGTRRPANFFAIDATTGEILWQFEPYAPAYGDPMVVDGVVFFGTEDGYLHAFDAGVEGSSEDRRTVRGTGGHHHSVVGLPEPDLDVEPLDTPYEFSDPSAFELPYGEWFDGVPNYEGTVDMRGRSTVTIDVGAGEKGMEFDPPAVLVDPGTRVEWRWTGRGGIHNVAEESGTFESEMTDEDGHSFYWAPNGHGVFRYVCRPHEEAGMRGALAAGDIEEVVDDVI